MAEVEIKVTAEVAQANAELKKLDQSLVGVDKAAKENKLSMTDLKSSVDMAIGVFKGMYAAVKSVIDPVVDYAKEVRDLGRTIGATSEESSKLIQAADDVGVSAGTLQAALQAAIRKGVEPTVEGIAALAEEYNRIQDPIARTKFLMDNFGRSGAALAPLMEQGAAGIRAAGEAAEDAGLVMGGAAVQAARDYEIALDDVEDSALALKIRLAQDLLPAVVDLFDGMTDQMQLTRVWNEAQELGIVTTNDWAEAHHAMASGFLTAGQVVERLTDEIKAYKAGLEEADPAVQNLRLANEAAAEVAETYTNQLSSQTQWLADLVPALSDAEAATKAAARAQREHAQDMILAAGLAGTLTAAQNDYQAVLAETTPEMKRLTDEIAKYEAAQGTTWTVTTDATASMAEYELAQIRAAEAAVKLAEYTGDNRKEFLELQVAAETANEKVSKLGEQMGISTVFTADYTTRLAENNAELAELKLKNEEAAAALQKTSSEFVYNQLQAGLTTEMQMKLANELGLLDDASYLAASALQTLSLAQQAGQLSAEGYYKSALDLRDTINSLQSRDIEINISTFYHEYRQQSGTAAGPHEGDYGAAGEGAYNGPPAATPPNTDRDQRASGGPVSAGHPYLVGEQGPEMFLPAGNGSILNTGQTDRLVSALEAIAKGGGGNTYIVNGSYAGQDQGSVADELALMSKLYG